MLNDSKKLKLRVLFVFKRVNFQYGGIGWNN